MRRWSRLFSAAVAAAVMMTMMATVPGGAQEEGTDEAGAALRARPEGKVYFGVRTDDGARRRVVVSVSPRQAGVFADQGDEQLVRVLVVDYKSPACVEKAKARPGVLHVWAQTTRQPDGTLRLTAFDSQIQGNGHVLCASSGTTVLEDQPFEARYDPETDRLQLTHPGGSQTRLRRICDRSGTGPLNVVLGDAGDNLLVGTSKADIIDARQGDDIAKGGPGNDIICAGPGTDIVRGGKGFDIAFGQADDDSIYGGRGPDLVVGDASDEGRSDERVRGGEGHDVVIGGLDGATTLLGQPGADVLFVSGAAGGVRLDGGGGFDECRSELAHARFVNCEIEVGPTPNQHTTLQGLPWASPSDAHRTPRAAVESFVDFMAQASIDPRPYQTARIGPFLSGDANSGEVELRFTEQSSNGSSFFFPVTTVLVRKSGPEQTWWVAGSIADRLRIDRPEPFATVSPRTIVEGNNDIFVTVRLQIYAAGESAPFEQKSVTGGGVFALGDFRAVVDADGPDGRTGTFLFVRTNGVTAVPVTFAG